MLGSRVHVHRKFIPAFDRHSYIHIISIFRFLFLILVVDVAAAVGGGGGCGIFSIRFLIQCQQ